MSEAVDLIVIRPYSTVEEFLDGDAWTVGRSDMLLVDQAPLPAKTVLRFEIQLTSGEVLVRGEGWAAECVMASATRPGGLRVRFRRFDGPSKSLLRRALDHQKKKHPAPDEASDERTPAAEVAETVAASPDSGKTRAAGAAPPEKSGVRHAPRGPVSAPQNREELLARLRARRGARADKIAS